MMVTLLMNPVCVQQQWTQATSVSDYFKNQQNIHMCCDDRLAKLNFETEPDLELISKRHLAFMTYRLSAGDRRGYVVFMSTFSAP